MIPRPQSSNTQGPADRTQGRASIARTAQEASGGRGDPPVTTHQLLMARAAWMRTAGWWIESYTGVTFFPVSNNPYTAICAVLTEYSTVKTQSVGASANWPRNAKLAAPAGTTSGLSPGLLGMKRLST